MLAAPDRAEPPVLDPARAPSGACPTGGSSPGLRRCRPPVTRALIRRSALHPLDEGGVPGEGPKVAALHLEDVGREQGAHVVLGDRKPGVGAQCSSTPRVRWAPQEPRIAPPRPTGGRGSGSLQDGEMNPSRRGRIDNSGRAQRRWQAGPHGGHRIGANLGNDRRGHRWSFGTGHASAGVDLGLDGSIRTATCRGRFDRWHASRAGR